MVFQRWWVLKSKLFAQESTCSKEILISTSLNHLWFSVVGVIKVDYLDFPCENFEILCELDAGIIACNFLLFGFFLFFSDFFRSNSFIFEPKVEKMYMGVFSTQFVPLISILATKILEEQSCQLWKCWFLQTAEVVGSSWYQKNIDA